VTAARFYDDSQLARLSLPDIFLVDAPATFLSLLNGYVFWKAWEYQWRALVNTVMKLHVP
jgi:hypothetical protein